MENVDLCVCCGDVVPEGTMLCFKCQNRYKDIADKSPDNFMEEYYGVKLHWYQRILLDLCERTIKISRKGLHRYL